MPTARKPSSTRTPIPSSCAWLARSRNLKHLWLARILVHLYALKGFNNNCEEEMAGLRLPRMPPSNKAGKVQLSEDLRIALSHMEANASRFRLNRTLDTNLNMLARRFALTRTERLVLALAVLLETDETLMCAACHSLATRNVSKQIATVLRVPLFEVTKAISTGGCLRKCDLINIGSNDNDITENLKLSRASLQTLTRQRLASPQDLFTSVLHIGPAPSLNQTDYAHLRPNIGFVFDLLGEALKSKRRGVNILLYGPPGTGKTECARMLARELTAPLYEIAFLDSDSDPLGARRRLQAAAMAQHLLRDSRALLMFDEIDAAFNDGSDFMGKPTTAESSKAWVNDLLEKNRTPMIWIANEIDRMDPAFVRRFDLVIPMEPPPLRQRERLLEKLCGDALDPTQIRRFAQVGSATPAVVTRAINVVRRVACVDRPRAELLETVLDGTLTAQGHTTVRCRCQGTPVEDYDVSLCNADTDLKVIVQGLAKTGVGRICLYGPPGTGKTAFGHWLAKALDRPLILKRASDIQDPFLGVMEKKLARAFEQAERDRAVLQIDEVDTFLQDRRNAQHQWEVSQTNEFLTQLESFSSVFIASTNLMAGLDRAALRRFDYKIRVDYLRAEQSRRMFEGLLHDWNLSCADDECLSHVARMSRLTLGDFTVMRRRHAVVPFTDAHAVLSALQQELEAKTDEARPIGFV